MDDGAHIKILLLTFFFHHMEELIKNGHVYVAESPLYKVTKGKNSQYLLDENALNDYKKAHGNSGISIQRFKGLGELSPDQLKETTMDITKRRLRQVIYEDRKEVADMFNRLMGTAVGPRKDFIQNNAYKVEINL